MSSIGRNGVRLLGFWFVLLFILGFILIYVTSSVLPAFFLLIILSLPLLMILRHILAVPSPRATRSKTYECSFDNAYEASLSALREGNFQIKEQRENLIKASLGVSLSSYGENIEVSLSPTPDGIEVKVISKPKWSLQLLGLAKCEENVSKFFFNLERQMLPKLSDLEQKVLAYIQDHQYKVRISECASELGKTSKEIEDTLKSLEYKGLLK